MPLTLLLRLLSGSLQRVPAHADDLDTRLLRAMVIKGILEQITTSTVNLVNADLLAKNRGLRIRETFVFAEGKVRPVFKSAQWPDTLQNSPYVMVGCLSVVLRAHDV